MDGMTLNNEIDKAIFILESSLAISTNMKNSDVKIGDITIPRRDAEALKLKFERFKKDGQTEKIYKAIPIKLVVVGKFWWKLQDLIRKAYLDSEWDQAGI